MDFMFDPSLVLYLPLYQLDGASLMSKDAHGHLCSVTGALWRPDGRYFDGADDKIQSASHTSFSLSHFTLEGWLKVSSIAAGAKTFVDLASANDAIAFNVNQGTGGNIQGWFNDGGAWQSTPGNTAVLSTTEFVHIALTYDRVNFTEYANGGEHIDANAVTAAVVMDDSIIVHIGEAFGGTQDITGTIGEIRIYNRALTPQEIQHSYQATKWRYR